MPATSIASPHTASSTHSGSYTKYPDELTLDYLKKDIRKTTLSSLKDDIRAGFSVALLSIPQAIAYSVAAGVPPIAGLLSTIFGTLIAALLGASRHLIIGPNNATVVLVQTAACEIFASMYASSSDPELRGMVMLELMAILTMLIGLAQIIASIFKFGRILQFVSHSVVVGYIAGSALAITVDQLFIATGMTCPDSLETLSQKIFFLATHLKGAHSWTVILALSSLGFLFFFRGSHIAKKVPPALLMLFVAGAAVWTLDLPHKKDRFGRSIALAGGGTSLNIWAGDDAPVQKSRFLSKVPSRIEISKDDALSPVTHEVRGDGNIDAVDPKLGVDDGVSDAAKNSDEATAFNPLFDFKLLNALVPVAFAIAFIGMLETNSIAKSIAVKSGQRLTTSQEIFALGCSNFFISFLSALPCSGSMSRTILNYDSGAKTRFSGVFSAFFVALIVGMVGWSISYLPQASLAAILLANTPRMVDMHQLMLCFRTTRSDALVLFTTFFSCIFFSLHTAFYMGVMLSIVLYLRKAATPRVVEYQYCEETNEVKTMSEEERQKPHEVRIINVEGELFFGAVDLFQYALRAMAEDDRTTKVIILRLKHVRDLDATAALALKQLKEYLTRKGRQLIVASIPQHVVRFFEKSSLMELLGQDNVIPFDENTPHSSLEKALDRARAIILEMTRMQEEKNQEDKNSIAQLQFLPLTDPSEKKEKEP